MITIKHASATLQVLPENAQATYDLLALIDKSKGRKGRKYKRTTNAKHDSMKRDYPAFYEGMTTGEYVRKYAELNERRLNLAPLEFTHADRAAPMFDPSMPLAAEVTDHDAN
jgi:hypothetical protein